MFTLAEILNKTKNGQEIFDVAAKLGFKNVRLYHSFSENTLCLVVDFDVEKEKSSVVDHNALILELNIAKLLNCKVMVLQSHLMSPDDKVDVAKDSVLLPIKTLSQLTPIFGDPELFKISAISEDLRYASDLKTFEIVFSKQASELDHTLSSDTMTPMASKASSPSEGSYHTAKKPETESVSLAIKPNPSRSQEL